MFHADSGQSEVEPGNPFHRHDAEKNGGLGNKFNQRSVRLVTEHSEILLKEIRDLNKGFFYCSRIERQHY